MPSNPVPNLSQRDLKQELAAKTIRLIAMWESDAMNAISQADARTEAINEALYDAICDGDGRPRPDALAHHLAKHGLVIVEAAEHDRMRTALQLIGSCELDHLVVTVARNALAK